MDYIYIVDTEDLDLDENDALDLDAVESAGL